MEKKYLDTRRKLDSPFLDNVNTFEAQSTPKVKILREDLEWHEKHLDVGLCAKT